MANQEDEIVITDTLEHPGTLQKMHDVRGGVLKIVNTLNQSVTVTVKTSTSDDKALAESVDREAKDVIAGGVDWIEVGESWTFAQAVAQCSTPPTSGNVRLEWGFLD